MNILSLAESPEVFLCLLLLCSAASSLVYSWRSRKLFNRLDLSRPRACSSLDHSSSERI